MFLKERIRAILAEVLKIDDDEIQDSTSPEDTSTWDSLTHVNLITALEQEFEITFDTYNIEDLDSFKKICDYVVNLTEN